MTTIEYLLNCAAEECSELAVRLSKANRFGLGEIEPGQEKTNAARIVEELGDLLGAFRSIVRYVDESETIHPRIRIDIGYAFYPGGEAMKTIAIRKQDKIEKYSRYSNILGLLELRERAEPYGCHHVKEEVSS